MSAFQGNVTQHGVIVGAANKAIASTAVGSTGQVLQANSSADPTYSTATYPSTSGSNGNVLTSNGTNWVSSAPAGGGGTTVTTYNTAGSFTWTKGAGTKYVEVLIWSGGSGGGSGSKYAVSLAAQGAGGGGGGAGVGTVSYYTPATFLGATETVVVGAGGAGGAAVTTNDTDGHDGSPGNASSFGAITTGFVGQTTSSFGGGGLGSSQAQGGVGFPILTPTSVQGSGGSGGFGGLGAGSGGPTTGTDNPSGASVVSSFINGTGGGGGGIDPTTNIGENGARGNNFLNMAAGSQSIILAGGAGGIYGGAVSGSTGNAGSSVTSGGMFAGGTGGGGGASSVTGNAGSGGVGGAPGGGGGGGGASINGAAHNSGAGGNGADGAVIVIEYS